MPVYILPSFRHAALAAVVISVVLNAAHAQATFYPADIGVNGVIVVDAHNTIYDGSDGTLFAAVPLPPGATKLRFRVTGGVITDPSTDHASPDGLYADGRTPYNWTATRFGGTYMGVPIGSATGIDPALFGVFFNPQFAGPPPDSLNYRSDSGIVPDPRTLAEYAPTANQPFCIGDGYDANNPFVTPSDSYLPPGTPQTFDVPAGATELVLGIAADIEMDDNGNVASGLRVHVYSDVQNGAAVGLSFVKQPGNGEAGSPLSTQPVVRAVDASGSEDTSYNGPVTLSLLVSGAPVPTGLLGTATVNAVNGIAAFSDIGVAGRGTDFALRAEGGGLIGTDSLSFSVSGGTQAPTLHTSTVGEDGVLLVDSHDTYYDGSDGTLFDAVPIPSGATEMQFIVTGGVITDSSFRLASPDGLYPDGDAPYNFFQTQFNGTYRSVPVGATTGSDPALFGVFFNPTLTGTPSDSDDYQSDSGISPDPRTVGVYSPEQNQPFFIGDGLDANNPFVTATDGYVPPGSVQTYHVPSGATQLLLGIGADIRLDDNQDGTASSGYRVHVYDDSPTTPPVTLAFSVQPAGGAPGERLARQPEVTALDAAGKRAVGFNGAVTVAIQSGAGTPGATLQGSLTVNAVNGIATFNDLVIDKRGLNYRLNATGAGLTTAVSAPFHVPSPIIWDAARDFSRSSNPAGAWSYGFETTHAAAFQRLPQVTTVNGSVDYWGVASIEALGVYRNSASEPVIVGDTTWPAGRLVLHPGPDGQVAVLRFTFPTSGVYRVTAHFEGSTARPATTDVSVLLNNAAIDTGAINLNGDGNARDFSLAEPFQTGDTLDFAVGYGNDDNSSDSTIVDAAVSSFPDVNGSGDFDLADVVDALRIAGGLSAAPNAAAVASSDFLSSGAITLGDALEMLRLL
jgi:hypothetical protein